MANLRGRMTKLFEALEASLLSGLGLRSVVDAATT